jgi:hypothetical protein
MKRKLADMHIGTAVAVIFSATSLGLFMQFPFETLYSNYNYWFDADPYRALHAIEDRWSPMHSRSDVHPLWSLFFVTPVMALAKLVGLRAAIAVYVAGSAALLGAALWIAMRSTKLTRLDSALGCLLFLSTASAWFWLGFPETFALGGVTVIVPLIWLSLPRVPNDTVFGVVQSLLSLSVTITNWWFGLLAAALKLPWKSAIRVSFIAFGVGAALSVLQYLIYPNSGSYFRFANEVTNGYGAPGGTAWQRVQALWAHSLAAPVPQLLSPTEAPPFGLRLSRFQFSSIAHDPISLAYFAGWLMLLVLSCRNAIKNVIPAHLSVFVAGGLGFTFCLHLVYGPETFLYGLHIVPLLTIFATWSAQSRERIWLVRAIMIVTIVLGMAHNSSAFLEVSRWHASLPLPDGGPESYNANQLN